MKKIIGFLGSSGSGKNAAATFVRQTLPGCVELSFAEPLKEFGREVFDFSSETLYGSSKKRNELFKDFETPERWAVARSACLRFAPSWSAKVLLTFDDSPLARTLSEKVTDWFFSLREESLGKGLTARRMLQTLGTECGRAVSQDVWVNYGIYRAEEYLREPECSAALITDVRFENEGRLLRAKGAEVWFMDRPVQSLEGAAAQHQSETEIRSPEMQKYVTRTFKNGGTLEELQEMVVKAVDETFNRHPDWSEKASS